MKTQIITCACEMLIDNAAEKYILLEDYLKYTNKDVFAEDKCAVLSDIYDETSYAEAQEYILQLSYKIIDSWRKSISRTFGIFLNERQAEIIMIVFVRETLFDLFYRYNKLKRIENEQGLFLCAQKDYTIERYMADYIRNIYLSDEKQSFLWKFVAERIGIEIVECSKIENIRTLQTENVIARYCRIVKNCITDKSSRKKYSDVGKRFIKRNLSILKAPYHKSDVIMLQTLLGDEIELEFQKKSCGKLFHIAYEPLYRMNRELIDNTNFDLNLRNAFWNDIDNSLEDEFTQIAIEYMKAVTPIGYIEAFAKLYLKSMNITKHWNVRKIYSAYTSVEIIDICEAIASSKGVKIVELQHSAVYPSAKYFMFSELLHGDEFCTWGWKTDCFSNLKCTLKAVAMIRLPVEPVHKSYKKKPKYLWTTNFLMKGDLGSGDNYSEYLTNQLEFVEALDNRLREKLVLRIDPNEKYNILLAEICKKKYPNIQIESRYDISFTESLLESELLICDYYGSPHLEALMLNRKWVMFNGVTQYDGLDCYNAWFQEFEKVGIYNKSGKALAKRMNAIEDFEQFLEQYQNLYDEYLQMFANPKIDIRKQWYEEFMSCIKEPNKCGK